MKTLANCTPKEFFQQTVKIRKAAEKWLKETNILGIRTRMPEGLPEVDKTKSKEENIEIIKKRKEMFAEQSKKNAFDMIDAMMDKHPDETIELMAMICFIDPEKANDLPMSAYLANINEIINDKAVMDFFTSLIALGVISTSDTAAM